MASCSDSHLNEMHNLLGPSPSSSALHKYLVKQHYRLNKLVQKTARIKHH